MTFFRCRYVSNWPFSEPSVQSSLNPKEIVFQRLQKYSIVSRNFGSCLARVCLIRSYCGIRIRRNFFNRKLFDHEEASFIVIVILQRISGFH